jgi:hypothetical protein
MLRRSPLQPGRRRERPGNDYRSDDTYQIANDVHYFCPPLCERSVCSDKQLWSVERTTFAALDGARLVYAARRECFNANAGAIGNRE